MFNSTVSDIGPCFFIMCKTYSKDQTCDVLGLLYIGFMLNIFLNRVVELLRQDIMLLVRKQKKKLR